LGLSTVPKHWALAPGVCRLILSSPSHLTPQR
jgi:hypothetical protein